MSEIRATTISDLAGTGPATLTGQTASKAWISLNGESTISVRGSANVSSITDISTGTYDVNLASSLTDANYSLVGMCTSDTAGNFGSVILCVRTSSPPTSSFFRLASSGDNGSSVDVAYVWAAAIR
jgi:hypothetical protein